MLSTAKRICRERCGSQAHRVLRELPDFEKVESPSSATWGCMGARAACIILLPGFGGEVPKDGYFVMRSTSGRVEIVGSPDFSAVRLGLPPRAGAVAERHSRVPAPLPHPKPIDEEDI